MKTISFLHKLRSDESGMAAEFALVLPLLLILFIGTLDVGLYAWRINQAEKATQTGARWAVVTDPLAVEISTASYVNTDVNGTTVTQGDRIPKDAMGTITCTSTGCVCAVAPCPGTTFESGAFTALSSRMQEIAPAIQDTNVAVDYSGSGLGFAGDPNGPDIAPIITVRLVNMEYSPFSLILFGGAVGLPEFAYSMSAEDSSGSFSN